LTNSSWIKKGNYFSPHRPHHLDPRAESRRNHARKNWNSVGDHAPAYLINLWLATGEKKYADMLEYTFDTIEKYFQTTTIAPLSRKSSMRIGAATKPGAGSKTALLSA